MLPDPEGKKRKGRQQGRNTEEAEISLLATEWVKTCGRTLCRVQEPWVPVCVLIFGEVTTGRRAHQGAARALEPSCLDSDAGPATWGQLLSTFVLLRPIPKMGTLPLVLGC